MQKAIEKLDQAAKESASYLLMLLGALLILSTELAGLGAFGADAASRLKGSDFVTSLLLGCLLAIAGASARVLAVLASARQLFDSERESSIERREQAAREFKEREHASARELEARREAALAQSAERRAAGTATATRQPYGGI